MKTSNQAGQSFQKLVQLMDKLRANCPWDKKQTHQSLQKYTLEEIYELMDAINENNLNHIKEELGDVLFHTIFYARIASEKNAFTITDVIDNVHKKLVHRHPHIFGDVVLKDEQEVSQNWEKIKLKEGKKSVLEGVPKSLPAVIKAYRMQQKAAQVGFDWDNQQQVWVKIEEELQEFKEAVELNSQKDMEEEFGDLLFSLINLSRFLHLDPENSLEKTNQKFKKRFLYIEERAKQENKNLQETSLAEMDKWWNESKTVK